MLKSPVEKSNSVYDPIQRKQFLIVEDDQIQGLEMEQLLQDNGAALTIWVPNLSKAREILAKSSNFAAVIVDLKLKDESGEDLISELESSHIPAVIVTAYEHHNITKAAIVSKPFSPETFLGAVSLAASKRQSAKT